MVEYSRRGFGGQRISRRTAIRGGVLTALGLGGAVLVGCSDSSSSPSPTPSGSTGSTPTSKVKTGGKLTTTAVVDPVNINPQNFGSGGDYQFFWTMFDNLVAYNQKGQLDPSISLAEKWEIADKTKITLTLRQGVKFHDGTPFNSEAVKYNLKRVQDASTRSTARADIAPISQIDTPSEHTVVLTLKKPNAALLTVLGDRGGAMVSPASIEKYGDDLIRNPVGTGPFIFKEWRQNDHVTVVKNPDYWGKDAVGTQYPYLDEIRWNIIPDAAVAESNFLAKTIDVLIVRPSEIDRILKSGDYDAAHFDSVDFSGVNFNLALAPADDVHFRRALAFSIDKKATIAAVNAGKGAPGIGPLAPASWAFNPNLKGLDYNPEEAIKELAQSKYVRNSNVDAVTVNSPVRVQLAELQQQMAANAGIKMRLFPLALAEYQERFFNRKDAPIAASNTFSYQVEPDSVVRRILSSTGINNPGLAPNKELDALIDKAVETYDINERKEYYDQIQKIGIEQVYRIYTCYGTTHAVASKKVHNLSTIWGNEGKQRYKDIWVS